MSSCQSASDPKSNDCRTHFCKSVPNITEMTTQDCNPLGFQQEQTIFFGVSKFCEKLFLRNGSEFACHWKFCMSKKLHWNIKLIINCANCLFFWKIISKIQKFFCICPVRQAPTSFAIACKWLNYISIDFLSKPFLICIYLF